MSRDHYDALLDQLLREILGGDRPRDLTARVLTQAKIYDRFRRRWWVSAATALAASVALAATLFLLWPQSYPNPKADGVAVLIGTEVQTGALIQTDEINPGNLELGNYVKMVLQPQTALTLGGSKYKEKVFLEQGELRVVVRRNKGQFEVAVGPAIVHVTGTKFNVNVINDESAAEWRKKLQVSVEEGSVEIKGIPNHPGVERLAAGESREFVILNTPRVIPPIKAALRGGLLAAAQEGVRLGNRGGAVGRAGQDAQPGRGQLAQTRGTRYVQLTLNPGTSQRLFGKLRRDHDLYYLETTQGANIYMFPQAAVPNARWSLPVGQSVGVIWTEGKVTDVVTP